MTRWIPACATDDVDPEDVVPFDHEGREYAIVRSPEDTFHATDGYCTHEQERLCDGLVLGGTIECPKHNGRFDYATGAALGAPVHVLRTRSDADALRARLGPGTRVGVIGAGFIGLELAASAVALGCAVTVLELGPRAMGRAVPAPVADVVARRHRDAGVDLRFGTRVSGLASSARGIRIETGRGPVDVDVVVAGVGAVPETALASAAGLHVADGIVVDEWFRTSAPGVFAAGDCCSHPHPLAGGRIRLESWRVAREHGEAAAAAMLGADSAPYAGVPWFWSDQYDLSLQVAGLPAVAVSEVARERPDGVALWFGRDGDGRLVAAAGVGPGNAVAKDVRLAEMLIARGAAPAEAVLADPAVPLKSLPRAPAAV